MSSAEENWRQLNRRIEIIDQREQEENLYLRKRIAQLSEHIDVLVGAEAKRVEARPPVDRRLVEEALEVLVRMKKRLDSGREPKSPDVIAFLEDSIFLPVIGMLRRALEEDPDAQRSGQWQEMPDWATS